MHAHAKLISVFLVEMGFYHVGQGALELLTSSDPPPSASQSAGIRGVSPRAWPVALISRTCVSVSLIIIIPLISLSSPAFPAESPVLKLPKEKNLF